MNFHLNARKLRLESLEERALLAVTAGGFELAALPEPAAATAWIVNTLDDAMDWDTADDILSLREAIARAQTGDTITFDDTLAGGTITLCGSELGIYNGITIDASAVGGITIDAGGQSRVIWVNGGNAENPVELISLTITGGWLYNDDGAICNAGTLRLTNVTVRENTAAFNGGGIYNYGTLTLTNTIVTENSAGFGGGIYNGEGTLELTDSTVSGNSATSGAGIYNDFGTLTLTNSVISGNVATNYSGGGIYNYRSTLTIIDSIISENVATHEYGGGIYNYDHSTLTLTNSTVSGNTATNSGGGIYNIYYGSLTLTGSTVSGNTANYGGGIYNNGYSGRLTLTGSTVSANTANYGGGIYSYGDYNTLTLTNSILSLNYAGENTDLYSGGSDSSYSVNHSIVGSDPGFVTAPVFEDGKLVNADELDLSLTAESIAIDRGTNGAVGSETDIAGNPRIVAAWREIPTVDIGAYEYQGMVDPPEPSFVVTTLLDVVDETDGLLSLREAIQRAESYDIIAFAPSLAGETVVLEGAELAISKDLIIDATSIGGITIDAYDQSRVFYIGSGVSVDLLGLTVTGGWTEGNGGGIYVADYGSLALADCTVTKNTATNYGGGIYVASGGMLTVLDSTVAENTATNYGGGIYNSYGTLTITGSAVSGNTASEGGGIYNNYGTMTITDSAVSGNTANYGGGIYNYSTLTITGSAVSGNTASESGGGIYNGGSLTMTNCIVSENTVYRSNSSWTYGGGIYNYGTLTITNSTITGNTAYTSLGLGGGVYCNGGTLTLTNTIVALNYASYDNNISNYSNPISGSNNIIGLNPGFVTAPVFENGVLVNAGELDLSLTAGSVAVDGGTNAAIETETDFAGNSRIAAAWRETATVDIGAFEYQGTVTRGGIETPSTVVTTVLDVADETDGLISLREAILYAAAGDTVTFDPSLASRTIVLDGADLVIDKNLSIDASALSGITIDGNYMNRIFTLRNASGRVTVSLTALAIRSGRAYSGGGIYNDGVILLLTNCTVTNSRAFYGGGLYNTNSGTLTATNVTVADNNAWSNNDYYGSALYTSGGTVTFYNSIVTGSFYVSSTRTYAYNTLSSDFTNWTRSQNCPTYNWSLPLFADPNHNDYTLAENSQAINAGNNSYVSTETDLAGNPRILNGTVDLGAYEYTGLIEPLDAPSILTGSRGVFVSYGANRHQVTWSAVDRAAAYEFAYSLDGGSTWTSLETNDTAAVVRGLNYGTEVAYRVRALSARYLENSDWSAVKSFRVCPMDINGDGDISSGDRQLLSLSWLAEEGSETYRYYADINGDGDISGPDRNILSANWLCDADDPYLLYPRPVAAEIAFAEYASADPDIGFDLF